VILSQLFRGFAKALEGKTAATAADLANAFTEAGKMAYKAVMKPKEGTILTIARSLGEQAQECVTKSNVRDIEALLQSVIEKGDFTLSQTPSMLPELKAAGVVDSGGKGLMCFIAGMLHGLRTMEDDPVVETAVRSASYENAQAAMAAVQAESITYVYCTEFLIEVKEPENSEIQAASLQKYLMTQGDSVAIVVDDGIIKVHVHTNHPGHVMEKALLIGDLNGIDINNMRYQHSEWIESAAALNTEIPEEPAEAKEVGFVAISAGEGLCALFTDLGADAVIEGGQTMNPSAGEIAEVIEKINAPHIIVYPNNKNIIFAAEQARALLPENSGKTVHVVPTKSIPQGVACLIDYLDTRTVEENVQLMNERMNDIRTGQVTYAVRDTVVDGREVKAGDILGLLNGAIVEFGSGIQSVTEKLIDLMLADGGEFVSIYYGEGIDKAAAESLCAHIAQKHPDVEAETYHGGQPLYYYILSVE
jgi:hypothetical protein